MKDNVYVSGHRNPDSDSICSAISYSYLLNKLGKYNAIPCRLGEVSRETEFILKNFNLEAPMLLKSVKQTVEDLNYDRVTVFSRELTLKTAWFLLKERGLRSAPVLEQDGTLAGLLSTSNIIEGFMNDWDANVLKEANTPIANVIDTLEAEVLYLNGEMAFVEGAVHVASMRKEEARKRINEKDIVIIGGDRDDTVTALLDSKISMIILTGNLKVSDELLKKLEDKKISVLSTKHNTYDTAHLIVQSIPLSYVMLTGDIKSFSIADTLEYMKEVMAETRYRAYPVVDLDNRCLGAVSRFALLKGLRKKVILVDHNERGQSIPGIEEADILEIIDHHRVADVQTMSPLYFRGEPLGCTNTIIYKMYQENQLEIPPHIAGVMLGAILSDTLIFKSPTCTAKDKEVALRLAEIAGVDVQKFGMDMFKAGTSLAGKTVEEIFNQDMKKFTVNDNTVAVAQVNTMDIEGFMDYKADMLEYMSDLCERNNLKFALLLLTDVINGNSEILAAGSRQDYIEAAFEVKLHDHQATLTGVVSRKKQVVPQLTAALVQ